MKAIDRFTAGPVAGDGVALSAINPKNLLLVVGAAAAIAQTGADTASQAVALAVFILIAPQSASGAPVAIYFLAGRPRRRGSWAGCAIGWHARTPRSWP